MPPTDPTLLLTLLMLVGLCGGVWVWNRIRSANSELKRINRQLSAEFGPAPGGGAVDILGPWLAPSLLMALLLLGICGSLVRADYEGGGKAHAQTVEDWGYLEPQVLTARVVYDPSATVAVPDAQFPPAPADARCNPLSLDYTRRLARWTGRDTGVPPGLILAVIHQESRFAPCAISSSGAKGLMQLKNMTAREVGVTDVFDPVQNVTGGARYLRYLLDRFDGDVPTALSAYLKGPGTVSRLPDGVTPEGSQEYVEAIMGLAEVLGDD